MADAVSTIKEVAEICRNISEGLGDFASEKGAADAKVRLTKIADGLDNISGKLFFKTKAALPFVSPLADYAQQLSDSFEEVKGAAAGKRGGPMGDLVAAVDDLDNDHSVLQAKVASQDIIIT